MVHALKIGVTRTVVLTAPVYFVRFTPRAIHRKLRLNSVFVFRFAYKNTKEVCTWRGLDIFTYLITKSVKCAIKLYGTNMVDHFIVISVD